MNKGSSIFFGIWSLLFVVGALVQINDPDPWAWVSIYLIAALLSGYVTLGRYPLIGLGIVTVLCFAGSLYYFPPSVSEWIGLEWEQQDLTMKTLAMEEARESLGLLLIAVVLGIAWFTGWRKKARLKSKYGPNYLS